MDYRLVIHKRDGGVSKHYYPDYDTLEYNAVFCQFSPNIIKAFGQKFSILRLCYKTLFTIVIMQDFTLTLTGGWAIFAIACIIYFIANIVYGFGLFIEKKIKDKKKE